MKNWPRKLQELESSNKFNKLKDFISTNHCIPEQYWKNAYKKSTCLHSSAFEKLRCTFIDALQAAGGPVRQSDKHKALFGKNKNRPKTGFLAKIDKFKEEKEINFCDFYKCLTDGNECTHPEDMVDRLMRKLDDFVQIGQKKAALLIKYLILYSDFIDKRAYIKKIKPHLQVPVDAVIKFVCKKLLNARENLNINEIDGLANAMFKENKVYLDDLWFWGHFATKKNKNKYGLDYEYGYCKLKTDPTFSMDYIEGYKLKNKLKKFYCILKRR